MSRKAELDAQAAAAVDIGLQRVAVALREVIEPDLQPYVSDDEAILIADRVSKRFKRFDSMLWTVCGGISVLAFVAQAFWLIAVAIIGGFVIYQARKKNLLAETASRIIEVAEARKAAAPTSPPSQGRKMSDFIKTSGFDVPPQDEN